MRLPIECGVHVDGPMSDTPFLHLEASGGGQQQGQQFAVRERWLQVSLPDGKTTGWLPANAVGRREAMPLTAFRGRTKKMPPEQAAKVPPAAVQYGRTFLGTPYLWGGSSSFGLDCSGFVQLAYRLAGVTLRRDADIQRSDERFLPVEVRDVAKAGDDLQPGDLVFFGKPDKITHVGMHFEGNRFIHSAGGAGVIVSEWGDDRYSPGFVDARRLDPERAGAAVTRFEAEDR
jgi:cell wall-associated NlpC family hydrolase